MLFDTFYRLAMSKTTVRLDFIGQKSVEVFCINFIITKEGYYVIVIRRPSGLKLVTLYAATLLVHVITEYACKGHFSMEVSYFINKHHF
jgi:hypothetical protein